MRLYTLLSVIQMSPLYELMHRRQSVSICLVGETLDTT
jgi:hypothetical protein